MNKKRFSVKGIIAVILAVLVLGSLSVASTAADSFTNLGGKYGFVVPTDSNLKAQKKSYTFYGDSGKLYFMRISKGKKNAKYAIEIFSDESMTHKIRNHTNDFSTKAGNSPVSITWKFKDVKSGKYYGRCYVYYENEDGEKTIDSSSLEVFTININRVGKKTVKITSVKNTVTGPKISWSSMETAEKYYVYRKTVGSKKWTRIATLGANATSHIDTKANSGNRYTYTVKCYDGKYNSLYNKSGVSIVYLSAPKLKAVAGSGAAGNAKVSWGAVSGASGYRVYRKGGTLSDYEWKLIATVKGGKKTSYTDTKAKSTDWNYTYTVKAYNSSSYSGYDSTGVNYDYIPAPTLKKATPYDTGMKLEWANKNDNVNKFYVYRKVSGAWKKLGETRNTYFIDTKAASGSTYTYTVKGISDTNAGAYSSKGISAKFIGTPDIQNITFNSKDASVVKWSSVKSAVGYKVYRKINNAKNWSLIATVVGNSKTTYNDTVKKASGDTYTYTVRAYDNKGKTGYFIPSGKTGTYLSMPVFTASQLVKEDGSLSINVSWDAVEGATVYNVYKRIPGASWTLIAEKTPALSFEDTTAANGVIYEYAVRARTNKSDISRYTTATAYATTIPVLESVTVGEASVEVAWAPAEGATGYVVYKAPKDGGDWVKAGEVTEAGVCKFADTDASALENGYFYSVSAVVNSNEGIKSNKIGNFVEIEANAVYNPENVSIDISWNATQDTSVTIEKAVNDEPAIILVENLQNASMYMDAFIEEGSVYTYSVTASASGKLSATSVVSAKYPHPPLESAVILEIKKTETPDSATCDIYWAAVEFADSYTVLRAAVNGEEYGEYEEIATVLKDSADENGILVYNDIDVPADGKYAYAIKAVAIESERDSSVSADKQIEVFKQLSGLSDLKYTSNLTEDGEIEVTLTWAPTEMAEKYVITRTTVATRVTVTLAELVPETDIEGAEPILKTYYVDTTAEENVKYIYRVKAVAENRGEAYNEAEFCYGTPLAYYTNYNYEKAQLEAMLGDSNILENGKEKYVNEVYEEVKQGFTEIDGNLSKTLTEEAQESVDTATESLKALKEKLNANAYYTVTFTDLEGALLKETDVVAGTQLKDIDAPAFPEAEGAEAYIGWKNSEDALVAPEFAVNESITVSFAKEEVKLALKEDAAISFTEDGYINGISPETTVADIKAQLSNDLAYVEIKDYLGNALADDAYFGTGSVIRLVSKYTNTVYEIKAAVIAADLDGNGVLNELDIEVMRNAATDAQRTFTFNREYNHAFFLASDLMQDGTIDIFDLNAINGYINPVE